MGPRRVIIGMTSGFHAAHQHIFISRLFCDTSISIQNISFIIHDIVTLRFCTRVPRVRGPMGRSCVFAVMLLSHFHPAVAVAVTPSGYYQFHPIVLQELIVASPFVSAASHTHKNLESSFLLCPHDDDPSSFHQFMQTLQRSSA